MEIRGTRRSRLSVSCWEVTSASTVRSTSLVRQTADPAVGGITDRIFAQVNRWLVERQGQTCGLYIPYIPCARGLASIFRLQIAHRIRPRNRYTCLVVRLLRSVFRAVRSPPGPLERRLNCA